MIKLIDILKEEFGGGEYKLPKTHKPGMRVPTGGACCLNCRFYNYNDEQDTHECTNKLWQNWSGVKVIPLSPNEYCSDWWEPMA